MIIDLPDDNVEEYVATMLNWLNLPPDYMILKNIQALIKDIRVRNETVKLTNIDIVTCPLFNTLDS